MLRRALHPLATETGHTRYDAYLGELAQALGHVGDVPGGLATIERALERSERTEGRWYVAELLRTKGDLILMGGGQGADAQAEGCFRQALDWADRQDVLLWRLRAATSLARLLRAQRPIGGDAIACLQPTYERFTEGFATVDVMAAKGVLDQLARVPAKQRPVRQAKMGATINQRLLASRSAHGLPPWPSLIGQPGQSSPVNTQTVLSFTYFYPD